MNRRSRPVIILLVCMLLLTACQARSPKKKEGDTSDVVISNRQSSIYTGADFDSAVDTIKEYFREHFQGCSMSFLKYVGDDINSSDMYQVFLQEGNYDQIMTFMATFMVSEDVETTLDPGQVQTDYGFILGRLNHGPWEIVNLGRG